MRSLVNEPAETWPRDMEIRVSVNDDQLVELLYIREHFALPTDQVWPRLNSPAPAAGPGEELAKHEVADWTQRWEHLWERAWSWTLEFQGAKRNQRPEELFAAVGTAPRWREIYGEDRFNRDAFEAWKRSIAAPTPIWPTPERTVLDVLTRAWEKGFDSCFVLPFAGRFAQQFGPNTLVLSPATRNDAVEYARALAAFSA